MALTNILSYPHLTSFIKSTVFIFSGDAECLSGTCTNGKCGIVDGKVTCTCSEGFAKHDNGLCVELGECFLLL